MNSIFAGIEHWPLSVWAREDEYAYFVALILHAWGMALLVGGGLVISLRALVPGASIAMTKFRAVLPVMWCGVALALPSGFVLLVAYPAKALTNPVFALKFFCLIGAAWMTGRLLRDGASRSRWVAILCLLLWSGGVAAGKLLLHTYHVLTVS